MPNKFLENFSANVHKIIRKNGVDSYNREKILMTVSQVCFGGIIFFVQTQKLLHHYVIRPINP